MKVRSFLITQLRDIAIVMVIGLTISTIFSGFNMWVSIESLKKVGVYSFVIGFSLWKSNQYITGLISNLLPRNISPKKELFIDIIATFFISATVIYIVNYFLYPTLYGNRIHDNIKLFLIIGIIQLFISLLISGAFYLKKFFTGWLKLSLNEEKLKRQVLNHQYQALKSYVNPHFLFNSLSVLSSLIDEYPEKSQEFIKQLSTNYRYVIEQKDKEIVPLNVELKFIQSFIKLHQIRNGNNLKVSIDIQDTSGYIIPLSLQILLENCFKHNIISKEKPLHVKIWRDNNFIVVRNNLQTRKTISDSGGVGLDTISKQYIFLTDNPLRVEKNHVFFTVKIPIIQNVKK